MTSDDFENVLMNRFSNSFGAPKRVPNDDAASPATPPPPSFGNVDREARKARERRIARTPAQRQARAATRSELVNFKTTIETYAMLMQVAAERDTTMTAIIEEGLAVIAAKHAKAVGTDLNTLIDRGLDEIERRKAAKAGK